MSTRDRYESRKKELELQLEHFRQQFAITQGAIADIDYWISQLDSVPDEGAKKSKGKAKD